MANGILDIPGGRDNTCPSGAGVVIPRGCASGCESRERSLRGTEGQDDVDRPGAGGGTDAGLATAEDAEERILPRDAGPYSPEREQYVVLQALPRTTVCMTHSPVAG